MIVWGASGVPESGRLSHYLCRPLLLHRVGGVTKLMKGGDLHLMGHTCTCNKSRSHLHPQVAPGRSHSPQPAHQLPLAVAAAQGR